MNSYDIFIHSLKCYALARRADCAWRCFTQKRTVPISAKIPLKWRFLKGLEGISSLGNRGLKVPKRMAFQKHPYVPDRIASAELGQI